MSEGLGEREGVIWSDLDEAQAQVQAWKARGLRVVLANGCFDLIHAGHVAYLRAARRRGDRLVVAVNSDASVGQLKGPGRPIFPLAQRLRMVAALEGVSAVVSFDDPDVVRVLEILRPHVHCKGGDYPSPDAIPEYSTARRLGIESRIVGGPKVQSSRWLVSNFHAWRIRAHLNADRPGGARYQPPTDTAGSDWKDCL